MRKKRAVSRLDRILDMPQEVVSNDPKLTIAGFEKIWIENYKNILEYEDIYIKINTYIGVINISGFNLKLIHMTEDDLMVTGKIDSIDFESNKQEEEEEK